MCFGLLRKRLLADATTDVHRLSKHVLNSPHALNSPQSHIAPTTVNTNCESPVAAPLSSKQELLARLAAVAAPVQPPVQGGQPERPGQPAAPSNIDSPDAVTGSIQDPFRRNGRCVPQREDWVELGRQHIFRSDPQAGYFEGEARIGAQGLHPKKKAGDDQGSS